MRTHLLHYFQNFALNQLDEFLLDVEFEFISHKCILEFLYMVAFITILVLLGCYCLVATNCV